MKGRMVGRIESDRKRDDGEEEGGGGEVVNSTNLF
jgi:hypothetical protein